MVAGVVFFMTVKWICSVQVFLTKLSLDFLSKEICKTLGGCPMPWFIKMCQCSNLRMLWEWVISPDWMSLCRTFLLWVDYSFFFLVMAVYCRQIYFFLAIFLTCIYCWGLMAGSNVPFILEDSVKVSNLFWIISTWTQECQHMKRKLNWMQEEVLMFSVREKSLPNSLEEVFECDLDENDC